MAMVGGIAGSLLTLAALIVLAPNLIGPKLVRAALTKDPQILIAASDALRSQQYAQAIAPIRAALETPYESSWRGAKEPKVTLTYFYDYACAYCRKSNPVIDKLIAENPDLRVVYRELPILGPDSVAAARVSLAASKSGKFGPFHDALYAEGRPSSEAIANVANAHDIPPEAVRDPAIEAEISRNLDLAGQLGATGTPLFVVGNQVFNSAVGYDALKKAIEEARKG